LVPSQFWLVDLFYIENGAKKANLAPVGASVPLTEPEATTSPAWFSTML
jgi:hypothetical protein